MRLLFSLLLLLSPLLVNAAESRAVWTWEKDSYIMLESRTAREDAYSFLVSCGVNTIYLYADAYRGRNLLVDEPLLYQSFIADAHRRGFKVYALLGSYWLNTERYVLPEYRARAESMFQRVLDYNLAAPLASRFDGVNLDIEPHLLDEWNDHTRERLVTQFVEISARWMEMKSQSGAELSVGPAMPFWFDNLPVTYRGVRKPASEHLQDLYDYVALMDYRHVALGRDSITAHAQDEMRYGEKIGKPVVIGLELTPNELRKVTFNHLTEADLKRETALTSEHFASSPAFGGYVFHHYSGYRDWVDKQD